MAKLKIDEVRKMNEQERNTKLKELKIELIRSNVTAQKSNAKSKEIKKAIARLHTFAKLHHSNKYNKEVLNK